MIRGSKKLPESAVADWHGDEEPRYLKVVNAIAGMQRAKKRALKFAWATGGCGATILAGLWNFQAQLAVGSLLAAVTIFMASSFMKRVLVVREIHEDVDQSIRILPEEPEQKAA